MSNGRFFILTIPFAAWTLPAALPPDLTYLKGQQETGANGYHHWQLICRTSKVSRCTAVKALFCQQAHVELSRSAAANSYVWKDDTRVPGTQFELGILKAPGNQVDWDAVKQAAIAGDYASVPASILVRHISSIKSIHAQFARPTMRPFAFCRVYTGPTGTGKTHRAWSEAEEFGPVYWKSSTTKWWDGYHGQENVVLDEYDGQIGMVHLLRWLDKFPCLVEIKGGSTPLKAIRFWITSNLPVAQWYVDGKTTDPQRAALARRVTETVIAVRPPVVEVIELLD